MLFSQSEATTFFSKVKKIKNIISAFVGMPDPSFYDYCFIWICIFIFYHLKTSLKMVSYSSLRFWLRHIWIDNPRSANRTHRNIRLNPQNVASSYHCNKLRSVVSKWENTIGLHWNKMLGLMLLLFLNEFNPSDSARLELHIFSIHCVRISKILISTALCGVVDNYFTYINIRCVPE